MSLANIIFTDPGLEVHMRFICPECGKEYVSFNLWRIHLKEDHEYKNKTPEDFNFKQTDDVYYECQVCNTLVENVGGAIAFHRFVHLPYSRIYRCRYCTEAFAKKRVLCEHFFNKHAGHVGKIDNGKAAPKNARLTDPKLNSEFYLRFLCPQCGILIERYQEWLSHIEKAHRGTSTDLRLHRIIRTNDFYCMVCKNMLHTNEKSKLQRHRFKHLPYKEYFQCAYCSVQKVYKTEVLHHFIYVHKREFEAAKPYIRLPSEWGSKPDEGLVSEIQDFLKGRNPVQPKREFDLIQTALEESGIDLEEELESTVTQKPQTSRNIVVTSSTHVNPQCFAGKQDKQALKKQKPSVAAKLKQKTFSEEESESEEENKLISVEIVTINASAKGETGEQDKLDESVVAANIHYICPMCGLEITDHMKWRRHVKNQHDMATMVENNYKMIEDNSALCLNCMDVLPTQKYNELQRHHLAHSKYHNYLKCKICGMCKSRKPEIITHIEICHKLTIKHMNTGKYTCKNCGKKVNIEGRWYWNDHRDQCKPPTQEGHKNTSDDISIMEHLEKAWQRLRAIKAALDAKEARAALDAKEARM